LPSKEIVDLVTFWAAVATLVALPLGLAAVVYAGSQLSLAQKAGSGASLLTLSEAFRECWGAYIAAETEPARQLAFGDLANSLEIACALFRDKIFFGKSRDLLERYLMDVFWLIESNVDARERLAALVQTLRTFENIAEFVENHPDTLNSHASSHR
jgi:hypothetical protein